MNSLRRRLGSVATLGLALACNDVSEPTKDTFEIHYPSATWLVDDGNGGLLEQVVVTNGTLDCERPTDYDPCHPSGILWRMGFNGRVLVEGPLDLLDDSVVFSGTELRMDPVTCELHGPIDDMPFEDIEIEILEITETDMLGRIVLTPTLYQGVDGAEVTDVTFRAPRCGEIL